MSPLFACVFQAAAVFAQPVQDLPDASDNPIPSSGGAIKFAEPAKVSDIPHALDAGWEGEKTCTLLEDNARMRAFKCTFAPGVGHERHYHNAHFGYVVEGGTMQTTDADGVRERDVPTGRSWWSDGVAWHEALNIGDTTSVYIIVEPKLRAP